MFAHFEHDLHKRFTLNTNPNDEAASKRIKVDMGGNVQIDERDVEDIKDRYRGLKELTGESEDSHNKKVFEKVSGKTKMSAHIYRFKGCISECFEPYLK